MSALRLLYTSTFHIPVDMLVITERVLFLNAISRVLCLDPSGIVNMQLTTITFCSIIYRH